MMSTPSNDVDIWRERIGRVGVWLGGPAHGHVEAATATDRLGYGALWLGGSNRDEAAIADLGSFLDATTNLVVGTGIANIWAWEPAPLARAAAAVDAAHPGRFILGLGVGHRQKDTAYERPLAAMRRFLDGLDEAGSTSFRVVAALRPKMLELARDRSGGAHPYFITPEHTAFAREVMGPGPLLIPEQAFVLETDPARARAVGRSYVQFYFELSNYVNNLHEFGFGDEDFAGGGSDRLVDAIVAWGTEEQVSARIQAHLDAGADHVAIQPLDPSGRFGLDQLERLAPALVRR